MAAQRGWQRGGVDDGQPGDRAGEHDVQPAQPGALVGLSRSDRGGLDDHYAVELQTLRDGRRHEMQSVLAALLANAVPWGIVTNKATRFSDPLVRALGLLPPAATLVCGDTTPHAKPHPEPLLEAARRIGVAAAECIYVGDDLRDVQAGRAAGMTTVAVAWGYLGAGEPIAAWGADHLAQTPNDLLKLLRMA